MQYEMNEVIIIGYTYHPKKGYCDLVIDNSGTPEETREQVEELWKKLKELQKQKKNK